MILVDVYECGPVATNAYVLSNPRTREAVVIDTPPDSAERLLLGARSRDCAITQVLLTHTHWDHTADCADIVRATGASVSVHALDAYRLIDPMRHTVWPLPFTIEPVVADRFLEGGQTLRALEINLEVLHTPGHTEGGICFVDHEHRQVFVGDTLFRGSVGRTDLPGGDMDQLIESIRTRLYALPDDYLVYPGHGPRTTIGDERRHNPFVGESAE